MIKSEFWRIIAIISASSFLLGVGTIGLVVILSNDLYLKTGIYLITHSQSDLIAANLALAANERLIQIFPYTMSGCVIGLIGVIFSCERINNLKKDGDVNDKNLR